jgi:hypothetical protein
MSDEMDLLRQFHTDVPEASPEAWDKSRAAIAAVARTEKQSRRGRVPSSKFRALVPVVASMAAVALLVAGALVLHGLGGPGKPTTTQGTANWGLSGYLDTGADAPLPSWMTCPTASTCYVVGDPSTTSESSQPWLLYVSQDGTQSWKTITQASNLTFTTQLSCWSATSCAAGVTSGGVAEIAYTADGGHGWSFTPLPSTDGKLFALECSGQQACHGLASTTRPSTYEFSTNATFVTITGSQVTDQSFEPGWQMQELACPTAGYCVAGGVTYVPVSSTSVRAQSLPGLMAVSSNGGRTWHRASMPAGFKLADTGFDITCPSASECFANSQKTIIFSVNGGANWSYSYDPGTTDGLQIAGVACPSASTCQAWGTVAKTGATGTTYTAAIVTSANGGAWALRLFHAPNPLPSGVNASGFSHIYSVQCPGASFCAGLGGPALNSSATPVFTFRP